MLSSPKIQDQEDIKILMSRAAKSLNIKDIPRFTNSMIVLDKLIREFKHESFNPEFYDFVSDEDLWGWIYTLENKKLDNNDWALLSIVRDSLIYFISLNRLFNL